MRVTESERAFLHELHAVKKSPMGKRLIHFCVSSAPPAQDMHRRVEGAKSFIKRSFSRSPYCEVFQAHNNDIFVTYSHVSVSEVLAVCNRVEKLFCEDPVSSRNAYNEYAFYKVADAVKELDQVFAAFKSIIGTSQPKAEPEGKPPMGPEHVALLAEKLRTTDLRHCIFNQPVYFIGNKVPSIEFLEFYVASKQIESVFLPDVSMVGSPWLFHALSEDYDRATLRAMGREIVEYRHKAFSVNISLSTILSKEFADFYGALPSKLGGKIVLEIHKTDLVQNFGLAKDVKALAAEKGLRLCIDGVEWRDFELLNFAPLAPDFVKVVWRDDLLAANREELAILVRGKTGLGDSCELVLSRCDNAKAFPFARTLGVKYVQGRLADQYFKTGMQL
ncbi:MAG: EAL domain-containing protein [Rhodospirillaceae bacterium]|nr:EAL domain-containing protein [Rhodospirillales bacterium]